jgi:hypothetical protein
MKRMAIIAAKGSGKVEGMCGVLWVMGQTSEALSQPISQLDPRMNRLKVPRSQRLLV